MEYRSPKEWAEIVEQYLNDTEDIPPEENEEFSVETGGLYSWREPNWRRTGGVTGAQEEKPNGTEENEWLNTNTDTPEPIEKAYDFVDQERQVLNDHFEQQKEDIQDQIEHVQEQKENIQQQQMQQTFNSPVSYNNQNQNMNQAPQQQQPTQQQNSNKVPNESQFVTPSVPNKGIHKSNTNTGVTNVNNKQYSNVNPNTMTNLNQPGIPRNVNEISDDGNIMCTDCIDCRNCFNCNHCVSCDRCTTCDACRVCDSCLDCVASTNMYNCHNCNSCNSVRDSENCTNCNNCHHIINCSNCSDLCYAVGYVKNKKVYL